jgi:hypothetical protein
VIKHLDSRLRGNDDNRVLDVIRSWALCARALLRNAGNPSYEIPAKEGLLQ